MQLRLALTYAQSFSPARLVTGTMCVCVCPNNGFHISAHFPDSGKASHALQENTNWPGHLIVDIITNITQRTHQTMVSVKG